MNNQSNVNAPIAQALGHISTHLFSTIKGTAMNKNRARVWLESAGLAEYGFARGERITIKYWQDAIVITLDPEGARKVAGRERRGKSISILDICFPAEQRDAMFNQAAELDVHIMHGTIIIREAGL